MACRKKPKPWTSGDVKPIRGLAGEQGARAIARKLWRTEGAVRKKAHGLALGFQVL